ncbi:MAG: hypothetical protein M3R63_12995 [Actinomycetota bacterium]|nr:hypothetical protein [Actinomycetota bacterium]
MRSQDRARAVLDVNGLPALAYEASEMLGLNGRPHDLDTAERALSAT